MNILLENNVPKSKGAKNKGQKWITREIVQLLRKKKNAWRKYKKDMTNRNKSEYDEVAKRVKYTIRRAKTKMEKDFAFSGEDNGKKFREYIKSKTRTRPKIGPIVDENGTTVTDANEMLNLFNNYFSTVLTKEDLNSIPDKATETNERLAGFEIYEKDIVDKINQLKRNSAPGPDGIGPLVLQK